jgi:hypothetical protein
MLALQCQHFYFLGVLLFGLSLTMVMTFRSTNINSINVVVDSGQNQTSNQNQTTTSQPNKQLVEEQVSYPWIGDPTCQHFPVQV